MRLEAASSSSPPPTQTRAYHSPLSRLPPPVGGWPNQPPLPPSHHSPRLWTLPILSLGASMPCILLPLPRLFAVWLGVGRATGRPRWEGQCCGDCGCAEPTLKSSTATFSSLQHLSPYHRLFSRRERSERGVLVPSRLQLQE